MRERPEQRNIDPMPGMGRLESHDRRILQEEKLNRVERILKSLGVNKDFVPPEEIKIGGNQ